MCCSSGTVLPLPLPHPLSLKLGWGGETGVPHIPGVGCRPLSVGAADGGCLPGGRHPNTGLLVVPKGAFFRAPFGDSPFHGSQVRDIQCWLSSIQSPNDITYSLFFMRSLYLQAALLDRVLARGLRPTWPVWGSGPSPTKQPAAWWNLHAPSLAVSPLPSRGEVSVLQSSCCVFFRSETVESQDNPKILSSFLVLLFS